jgi:hypothetical protein
MRTRIVTLLITLLAGPTLVRGQSSAEAPASANTGVLDPAFLSQNSPPFLAPPGAAPDAEAAEEIEAKKPRLWVRGEFLLWWIKSANVPALVTTGPYTDPAAGALSSPYTKILYGQNDVDYQDRTGGRFTFGVWLDDAQTWGIDAGYFFLRGRSVGQGFSSPGNPILAMPFFNVLTGTAQANPITFPGVMSGQIVIDAPSFLQGAELNLTGTLWEAKNFHLQSSLGFRYLNLNEALNINSVSLVQLAPQFQGLGIPDDGNTISTRDSFQTHNNFYGPQFGTQMDLDWKRFTLSLNGKVALGASSEIVTINGSTGINTQPATAFNSGFFAVASNSGRFTTNTFAVVPEIGLMLKFRLTEHIQIFGGYSFLYWSRVVRPGDQIDTSVNPNLVPTSPSYGAGGPGRPAFGFHQTDFYAQGANFGLEFRY